MIYKIGEKNVRKKTNPGKLDVYNNKITNYTIKSQITF